MPVEREGKSTSTFSFETFFSFSRKANKKARALKLHLVILLWPNSQTSFFLLSLIVFVKVVFVGMH